MQQAQHVVLGYINSCAPKLLVGDLEERGVLAHDAKAVVGAIQDVAPVAPCTHTASHILAVPVFKIFSAPYSIADQAAVGLIVMAITQLKGNPCHAPEPEVVEVDDTTRSRVQAGGARLQERHMVVPVYHVAPEVKTVPIPLARPYVPGPDHVKGNTPAVRFKDIHKLVPVLKLEHADVKDRGQDSDTVAAGGGGAVCSACIGSGQLPFAGKTHN
mmetsp:Transcript_1759/g.4030  ORF Transcript_1759/g.4030 Transcript_1759/m.4030 type:complete len:215 (+) Transcript_1759:842-1486(+)